MRFLSIFLLSQLLLNASDQILLKTQANINQIVDNTQVSKIEYLSKTIYLLHLVDNQNITEVIDSLQQNPQVIYAHPNIENKTNPR